MSSPDALDQPLQGTDRRLVLPSGEGDGHDPVLQAPSGERISRQPVDPWLVGQGQAFAAIDALVWGPLDVRERKGR